MVNVADSRLLEVFIIFWTDSKIGSRFIRILVFLNYSHNSKDSFTWMWSRSDDGIHDKSTEFFNSHKHYSGKLRWVTGCCSTELNLVMKVEDGQWNPSTFKVKEALMFIIFYCAYNLSSDGISYEMLTRKVYPWSIRLKSLLLIIIKTK